MRLINLIISEAEKESKSTGLIKKRFTKKQLNTDHRTYTKISI